MPLIAPEPVEEPKEPGYYWVLVRSAWPPYALEWEIWQRDTDSETWWTGVGTDEIWRWADSHIQPSVVRVVRIEPPAERS